jgi:hypothetical protein
MVPSVDPSGHPQTAHKLHSVIKHKKLAFGQMGCLAFFPFLALKNKYFHRLNLFFVT